MYTPDFSFNRARLRGIAEELGWDVRDSCEDQMAAERLLPDTGGEEVV
jgi:hypothetical protein